FAEKPGYRFTGTLVAVNRDASLTLARIDEPIDPLRTLPPRLPYEEELAMVRELVERAYEAARSGSLEQKRWVLLALAQLDPVGTFDRAEALGIQGKRWRKVVDNECTMLCIAGRGDLSRDNLRSFIELSDDHASVASNFCDAASRMGDEKRARRLEWLGEALLHARSVDGAFQRAKALARVAEGFALADERQRAAEIVAEAEKVAEPLRIKGLGAAFLYEALASAQACLTLRRALEWLERIGEARVYQRKAGELAVRLSPEHPDDALAIWQSAHERAALRKPVDFDLHGWEMVNIADLCFRLTAIDRARAERLARDESFGPTRMRGLGGVALALSQTDAKAGRQLLASVVRDELPRLPSGEAEIPRLEAPPITAAWLLPIAERIDPELARECFWRSLALRRPRSGREDFDDLGEEPDTELAKMLARYDREVARALLEPMAARLQQIAAPLATLLNARHAIAVRNSSHRKVRYTLLAAALVDSRWAVEQIAILPRGADQWTADWPLHCLASVVSPPYDERWTGEVFDAGWINYGAFGAGYWNLPTAGASNKEYHAKIR
ncbi:MAG TPA: hypothetical protein VJ783_11710, partial [Pirellulales bacterium]|nr:hypothetical protein [Pirellulales bacterium]